MLKDYKKYLATSLKPTKYKEFSHKPTKSYIFFQLKHIFLLLIIMLLISLPLLFSMPQKIESTFSSFDTLYVTLDVKTNGPITIAKQPHIQVDLDKQNITDENILFTKQGVYKKKFFKESFTSWDELRSIPQNIQDYKVFLTIFAILLIPSLILALYLFFLLEILILFAITFSLAFLIIKITKFSISNTLLTKILLIALTPVLILQILPFLYTKLFIIPFILYIILVGFAIWVSGITKYEDHLAKREKKAKKK